MNGPNGSRHGDGWRWWLDLLSKALLLGLLLYIAFYVSPRQSDQSTQLTNQQRQIQDGRHVSLLVTCGAVNGIITAGRKIVLGPTDPKTPVTAFERNLEKLGYPPRAVRRAAAKAASDIYAEQIAQSVRNAADGPAKGLVNADGTLNCARLQVVARAR